MVEVSDLLKQPLSNNHSELINQLTDIECKYGKLAHIHPIAKALKKAAYARAWENKGIIQRGEAKRAEAEIDDEVKEYEYLEEFLEHLLEAVKVRLALGKKLLELESR